MYCAIRNLDNYNSIEETNIKEVVIKLDKIDIIEILEQTKSDLQFVFNLGAGILSEEELQSLNEVVKVRDNIRFSTNSPVSLGELPRFFNFGYMNATSLDALNHLCELGVTDAYVSGQLAFQMKDARTVADRFGVKLRIVPNKAQVSIQEDFIQKDGNLTAFWVRPEDLHMYEDYVDVVEFSGLDTKQMVYYDVYFNSKKWKGDLNILIHGIYGINNKGYIPAFTEARLNCGKKCLLDKCHSCHRYNIASNLIVDNGLELKESI